jgi:hypothetical protein
LMSLMIFSWRNLKMELSDILEVLNQEKNEIHLFLVIHQTFHG